MAVAALALLAAEGLEQDLRRVGKIEGPAEPWRRRGKRDKPASGGPGGPKVKLRIPRGRP